MPLPGEWKDFGYNIREEDGYDTVDRLIKQLSGYAKAAYTDMTLLCHSFGGVLGVAAGRALLDAFPSLKLKIITMGTPLGGSGAASMMRLVKPGSTFLKNIGAYDGFMKEFRSTPLPCRTRALITTEGDAEWIPDPNDGVVTVASQMAYEHDPNFHPVKVKLNHFEVLLSDLVVSHVNKELAR